MQEFTATKKLKSKLTIDGTVYEIYAPTVGQADKYVKLSSEVKGDESKVYAIMVDYIAELGNIPKEELHKVDNDTFTKLVEYVTQPVKKN